MPYSYPDKYQTLSDDGERALSRAWRVADDGTRGSVLVVLPAVDRPSRSKSPIVSLTNSD